MITTLSSLWAPGVVINIHRSSSVVMMWNLLSFANVVVVTTSRIFNDEKVGTIKISVVIVRTLLITFWICLYLSFCSWWLVLGGSCNNYCKIHLRQVIMSRICLVQNLRILGLAWARTVIRFKSYVYSILSQPWNKQNSPSPKEESQNCIKYTTPLLLAAW